MIMVDVSSPQINPDPKVAVSRGWRFLDSVMVYLTLLPDHPRRAEPVINGLRHRIRAPISPQHIFAPLTHAEAQQTFRICGTHDCTHGTVRSDAVL
ncbi:hypothetical protein [Nitrospira sp. BLG_2]|uniref:hypothetical protein n=1 Tax=Nitrospira sp. BLG_2 TaxID=3397507 RepID=UPI003B9A2371